MVIIPFMRNNTSISHVLRAVGTGPDRTGDNSSSDAYHSPIYSEMLDTKDPDEVVVTPKDVNCQREPPKTVR